ncbi:hypothetical protein GTW51_22910 [Aurantimonas aggregata]|uniref:Uncharacterized protein n=1 Tax=Aurantimonas aggregata TaxID=2047720 RepID=A0A6L9MP27_9HYPH|nr:hypothetical protein [Aurantimonas aggregata]NDV89495.1 hypothetical protein [Aurantimonas aggregata]
MIDDLIRSATYGFGGSFGRDAYQAAKKNPLVLILVVIFCIVYGFRNLYLGIGRSSAYFFFVNVIGSLVLISVGLFGLAFAAFIADSDGQNPLLVAAVIGFGFICVLIGNVWGIQSRSHRKAAIEIAAENARFLADAGLHDSDFETDFIADRDGNLLKLKEQTADRMVFTVAGKRGLRAAIRLVDGRMVEYTGVKRI